MSKKQNSRWDGGDTWVREDQSDGDQKPAEKRKKQITLYYWIPFKNIFN